MSASQPALFNLQEFSDAGTLLLGGRVYTYAYGTTAQKTAFTDPAGAVPHTYTADGLGGQFIALDARGELPAPLYLEAGSYDIALKRADGSTVWTRRAEPTVDSAPGGANGVGATDGAGGTIFTTVAGFIAKVLSSAGATLIGFIQSGVGAVKMTVQDALRERVTVRQFGGKFDNAADDGAAFNRAILKVSIAGGGTVVAGSGSCKIVTPILHVSNVNLDLTGCTLNGDGTNTIIKAGAVLAGVLTDITPEYGTQAQGAGTNLVMNARIFGGRLANAACGIRGHRFNYGTTIEHVVFDASLTNSWITSHSWGLKVHQNLVYSPAIMKDFVDWTEVTGNSFEGQSVASGLTALTFATGGYGGSYSALISSNGFHHWAKNIDFTCEATNAVIESNHFEDGKYHITGSAQTCKKFRIRNNWMKANLSPSGGGVIAINFLALWDSEVGPNHYSDDGASTFDAYVVLTNSNCFGSTIPLPYSPPGTVDISKYQINDANTIVMRGGSNDPAMSQPTVETFTGSGYTVEKYKSRYHSVANKIPYCTVTYAGTVATIDTWIVSDAFGTEQECAFNFKCLGATTYILSGRFNRLDPVFTVAKDKFGGTAFAGTLALSNNAGALRITISGLSAGGNIVGWVKEL